MYLYGIRTAALPFQLSLATGRQTARSEQASSDSSNSKSLRDLLAQVRSLGRSLYGLERSTRIVPARYRSGQLGTAGVTSNGPLALNTQETASTLTSTEEINATPTSFAPFGPAFNGSSTALPTIDGIYDGSNGDDTLTFKATKSAVVGGSTLKFDVFNGSGSKIDTVDLGNNPPGTQVQLSNGLLLSLSAGSVEKDDTFDVQVSATVGSVVDPNQAFDGQRNDNPNLQYGFSVTAGSFDLNGTNITVQSNDSIQSVLDRINGSGAGVTGSFDAATERIEIVQDTPGSGGQIVLENDTSGFVAAMKLSGAVVIPGQDDERFVAIAEVPALSGISTGTFSINGEQISVDVDVDSLDDVMQRINSSSADAVASYDSNGNVVTITASTPGEELTLDSGDSNFFEVLDVVPGQYAPPAVEGSSRRYEPKHLIGREHFLKRLRQVAGAFRELYATAYDTGATEKALEIRSELQATIVEHVGSGTDGQTKLLRSSVGIDFEFSDPNGRVVQLNARKLSRAMRRSGDEVEALLFRASSSGNDRSLVVDLRARLEKFEKQLLERVSAEGTRGAFIDFLI